MWFFTLKSICDYRYTLIFSLNIQLTGTREMYNFWDHGNSHFAQMDSSTRIFIKLRLWGFRLGPTDVTHPLSTYVFCTFTVICYDRLKMAPIEVKHISSSCQTRMLCAFVSETHGNIIVHYRTSLCMRVWDPRKLCKKMREHYACRFQRLLRHACMLIRTRSHNACVSDSMRITFFFF